MIVLPEAFPDEDFRSVVCRYNHRTSDCFSESKKELFGQLSSKNPLFQTNLKYLYQNLPAGYTRKVEDIISQNTWYGFVRVWLSKSDQMEFLKQIYEGTDYSYLVTKYLPKDLFSDSIRFCPKCMEHDYAHWGTCYIHRAHQLSFMDFCPHHSMKLITKCNHCGTRLSSKTGDWMVHTPYCNKGHDLRTNCIAIDQTTLISKIKLRLYSLIISFRDNKNDIDAEFLHYKLLSFAWERGYIHYKGQIRKAELITAINEYYPYEIQKEFKLNLQFCSQHFKAMLLTQKSLKNNVLFNMLLLLFFTEDFESFLKFEAPIVNTIPFGSGPWVCKNFMCRYHKQHVVTKCMRIQKISGSLCIVGEFKCPYCGCIYSKRWNPDKHENEGYLIRDLGPVWKDKVAELYLEGYSAYQIVQMTGASYQTVQRFLKNKYGQSKKLSTSDVRSIKEIRAASEEIAVSSLKESLQQKRERLLELLDQHPTASRYQLMKMDTAAYNTLLQLDRDWMEERLPNPLPRGAGKLDFSTQDKELSQQITQFIRQLQTNYDRQICQSVILKCLSKLTRSRLLNNRNRFPESWEVIQQGIESIDEYVKRALPLIIANLKVKGISKVTYSRVINYRRIIKKASNETQEYIKRITNDQ